MYDQFIPRYIINRPVTAPGHIVTAEEWNNLWQLSVEQGDHVNQGLDSFIDYLNQTLLGADADEFLTVRDDTNQSVPLRTIIQNYYNTRERVDVAETTITKHNSWLSAALEDPTNARFNAKNANKLGDHAPSYYAPQTEIARLDGRVDDVAAGAIAAFSHNDISNRSATNAHPMSAIAGLSTALTTQETTFNNALNAHNIRIKGLEDNTPVLLEMIETVGGRTHNQLEGRTVEDAHPSTAITHEGNTLANKLNNIDAIIASVTGTVGQLSHNDLLNRNTGNAHTIAAITGLQTALDGKSATSHKHAAADITSGKLDIARIPTGDTSSTVALGNHTHAYAAASHTHTVGQITGLNVAAVSGLTAELADKQKKITVSTAQPSGGVNGDIWIVYG